MLGLMGLVAATARAEQVFDPDEPPETRYRVTRWLGFGGEIEVDASFRRNLRLLDRPRRDDRASLTPELSLAWSLEPVETLQAFLNVALARPVVIAAGGEEIGRNEEDVAVEIKEGWLRAGRLGEGFSVQVGRQRFDDERTWLYDEDLDAVKVRFVRAGVTAALSASRVNLVRTTWGGPDERDRTANYILHAIWVPRTDLELEGYVIARRGAQRDAPVFAGVRVRDEPVEDLDYWLDVGYVGGHEGSTRIRGFGVDAGVTYEWRATWKPSATLAVAFGSGDRHPDDRVDRSFRQTGLHQNESDFGGATDFKYYGEIFDPELSNLAIVTAGIGVRPSERWSVDLVYHYFLQHRAARTLRGAAIDAEPSGRSQRLGSEIDLVVGVVEVLDRIEVKAAAGYFFPGAAFRAAPGAWGASVEAQFRF